MTTAGGGTAGIIIVTGGITDTTVGKAGLRPEASTESPGDAVPARRGASRPSQGRLFSGMRAEEARSEPCQDIPLHELGAQSDEYQSEDDLQRATVSSVEGARPLALQQPCKEAQVAAVADDYNEHGSKPGRGAGAQNAGARKDAGKEEQR